MYRHFGKTDIKINESYIEACHCLGKSSKKIILFVNWKFCSKLLTKKSEFGDMNRGGSRTAVATKMERFVIIVNDWKPLAIITKSSILDVVAVLQKSLLKKERLIEIGLLDIVKLFARPSLSLYNEEISFNCRELRRKHYFIIFHINFFQLYLN